MDAAHYSDSLDSFTLSSIFISFSFFFFCDVAHTNVPMVSILDNVPAGEGRYDCILNTVSL